MACHVRGLMKVNRKAHTLTLSWGTTIPFKEMDSWSYLNLDKTHKLNHPVEGHPVSGPNVALGKDRPLPSLASPATSLTTPPSPTSSCRNTKTLRPYACPATADLCLKPREQSFAPSHHEGMVAAMTGKQFWLMYGG